MGFGLPFVKMQRYGYINVKTQLIFFFSFGLWGVYTYVCLILYATNCLPKFQVVH